MLAGWVGVEMSWVGFGLDCTGLPWVVAPSESGISGSGTDTAYSDLWCHERRDHFKRDGVHGGWRMSAGTKSLVWRGWLGMA